jgi:hypothetical protein
MLMGHHKMAEGGEVNPNAEMSAQEETMTPAHHAMASFIHHVHERDVKGAHDAMKHWHTLKDAEEPEELSDAES